MFFLYHYFLCHLFIQFTGNKFASNNMNIDKIAPIPPNKAPAPTKQCKKHNNLYLFCNQTPPVLFSFITVMELYGIDDNPLTSYVSV